MTFNCPDVSIDITSMTENNITLNFYFIKKESEMTEAMLLSYEALREKLPILKSTLVMSQDECLNIPKANLRDGKHIFIFEEFTKDNEAFKYIYNAAGVFIFGTRCLTTILLENIPTPVGLFHVHNLSMRGLIICPTGLPNDKKIELKQLVGFMGGIYQDNLLDVVTHLVSDNVRSVKYEIAAKNGIKVMHADWIKTVWQKSQNVKINVSAADPQFDSYKLPIFFNLCVTTTGLNVQDRNMIKTHIEENGGRYSASYNNAVDILIMERDAVGSQKFNAAQIRKKLCLLPTWITESVEKGYAIANEPYLLEDPNKPTKKQIKASTPTKIVNETISHFNPDNTQLSEISRASSLIIPEDININETNMSIRPSMSGVVRPSVSGLRSSMSSVGLNDYKKVLAKITLAAAKKAGNVLDGLSFHIYGFTNEETALLGKVLSSLGGTKIDHISDQITHIIVGAHDPKLFRIFDNHHIDPAVLKLDWLAKVIEEKRSVEESEFLIERPGRPKTTNEKPSPASKRAMKSLSSTFKKPAIPKFQLEEKKKDDVEDQALLSQYLEQHNPPIEDDSNFTEQVKYLMGKYVYVHGFCDSSSGTIILQECERAGANLVDDTFQKEIDYIIAPSQILPEVNHNIQNYKWLVSDRWLEDSTTAGECVPVRFYHKPLAKLKPKEKVLKDEIFVVSNYKGMEREYIKGLVNVLGGDCLEVLKRVDNPILISPNSTGAKFMSAKNWNLAVLPVEWLMECYDKKQRVDELKYVVGGTKPTSKNAKRRDSIVPSSQDPDNTNHNFDELDPPIENYGEEERFQAGPSNVTPLRTALKNMGSAETTPGTPYQLDISMLTRDMTTPRRVLTKQILIEGRQERKCQQAVSPRRKRIEAMLDTPSARKTRISEVKGSPYPELPACMKPTPVDYSLRPNSSPESQWFHKRKLVTLDDNYIEKPPQEKRPRISEKPNETAAHTNRKYDFFKGFDPNLTSPQTETNEASKFLAVSDDEDDAVDSVPPNQILTEADEDFRIFRQLRKKSADLMPGPSTKIAPILEQDYLSQKPAQCFESENMVEWKNVNDPISRRSSVASISSASFVQPIFGLNGFDEESKKVTIDRINSLGAEIDEKDFTHLMTPKPSKSEKFLMALAKGLYIVHYEYVGRCESQTSFLDEAEYEMGNPQFLKSVSNDYSLDVDTPLFIAPYKWRRWIKIEHRDKFKDGAFTGMKFIIAASKAKKPSIISIITAGGGVCLEVDHQQTFNVTMLKREKIKNCLVENLKLISAENAEIIRKHNIKVSNLTSVFSYLMSEEVPESF